jgi:cytochrome c
MPMSRKLRSPSAPPPCARACFALAVLVAVAQTGCDRLTGDPADRHARELLARHHCGTCHVIPGVPAAQGRVAASLDAFGRRSYIAGRIPSGDEQLARWLVDPQALVPGTPMPAMGVSAGDARVMAAYLRRQR